jgi:cytoskeletal protein CcmA (bactofilin family)
MMRARRQSMMEATRPGSRAEPTTIVAEGTDFRGDFTSRCPVIVNGRIEGDVKAPSVTVTTTGALQGKIEAKTIRCKGSVAGVLEADSIELTGAIARDTIVRAQRLNLDVESTSGRIELAFNQAVTVKTSKFPPAEE